MIRATGTSIPFRFVLIDLTQTAQILGARHQARANALTLLADTAVGSLLLSSGLKSQGSVSLAVTFSGDISLVQADSTPMGIVRAMIPAPEVESASDFELLLSPQQVQVIKRNEKGERIKESIVEASSTQMGTNLANYMLQSDQTRCAVGIFSQVNPQKDDELFYSVGFLVEAYPDAKDSDLEQLEQSIQAMPSMETFSTAEGVDLLKLLQSISAPFETEVIREITPEFYCPCSKEKSLASLASLDEADLEELSHSEKGLEMSCDYCREQYMISQEEILSILRQKKNPL